MNEKKRKSKSIFIKPFKIKLMQIIKNPTPSLSHTHSYNYGDILTIIIIYLFICIIFHFLY